jgi:hypothetical protein
MSLTGKTIGELALLSGITPNTLFAVELSGVTYHIPYSGMSSSNFVETTYNELYNSITGETLTPGTFYLITDFRTCYDQPDFYYDGSPITTGSTIYKQSSIEPIIVLSTSVSTISVDAYQPTYPNDRIQYDWTFNTTEVTSGTSYGRITERIDEFNNRTDYDHRTILFKRYRLFTYREDQPLNGTIELFEDGLVEGNNTSFTALTVGDVIYVPSLLPSYYEVIGITGNTTMTVSGDTIGTDSDLQFYKAIEEDNDAGGYFSYKRTNVKTNDFIEYTTFGNAIDGSFAKNNYVGNFANIHTNIDPPYTFLLANNVFLEGHYSSNKFGDWCFNNTFGTDNENNIWGDWCYQNVSTNDIDFNIIGHYFHDNLINLNLTSNHIGNNFNNNQLLAENNDDFEDNIIGNSFNNNIIYSRFYKNEILDNFNDNVIGDSGNLTEFEFYRNYIRNNFNENNIRNDFQNNQIGTNFQQNEINGEFIGNTILNGFNNNQTGQYFAVNNIGNGFNNNIVYDSFYNNSTDYYFYNNVISNQFFKNNIGANFEDNEPSNINLFGWSNLSTVSTRNYDVFNNSVNGGLSNNLLGKELVMKIISTSQYFKIKFTQWTQNNGGGGFQYERQEIDTNGNPIGSPVIFTKTNYEPMVDVIVEGVVEITRDNNNNNGIYNIVTEGSWDSGISPQDTEWNSIYTQENNGENFTYNKIGDNFNSNIIGNYFRDNQIGNYFNDNNIANDFRSNVIGLSFQNNTILDGFGFGGSNYRGNKIGNYFYDNNIGEYFYDNTISDNFTNNIIGDYFQWNIVNTNVEFEDFTPNYGNITGITYTSTGNTAGDGTYTDIGGTTNGIGINASFNIDVSGGTVTGVTINNDGKLYLIGNTITILGTEIGGYNNAIFSYNWANQTGTTGNYNGLPVTGGTGANATFDVIVDSNGDVTAVELNDGGYGYTNGDELVILGSLFDGTDGVGDIIITITDIVTDNFTISIDGVSPNPSVYELYTCNIFKNSTLSNRLSYYDGSDVLNIININE